MPVGFRTRWTSERNFGMSVEVMGSGSAGYEVDGIVGVGDVVGFDDFEANVLDVAVFGDLAGLVEHSFGEVGGDDGVGR